VLAEILTTGTELVRGDLVDTNSSFVAARLTERGFVVSRFATVGDDRGRIVDALRAAGGRADVVVVTGGLGPTTDDLTAACAATAVGVPLVRHTPSLDAIRRRFEAIGIPMTANNEKQADFPDGADVLPNARGTAPGFAMTIGRARFFFLPGVPSEMKHMLESEVFARLPAAEAAPTVLRLRVFGMAEAAIDAALAGVEDAYPGVVLGYRATFPEVEVKVQATAPTREAAQAIAMKCFAVVRERLGRHVVAEGESSLPRALGEALRAKKWTLAVAESCTGGLVGALLTDVPGSSDYFLLGVVAYANEAKEGLLGVPRETLEAHGAVSRETAIAMAAGVRARAGATIGVATTGIAGPGGGTPDKPVGLVHLAVAGPNGVVHKERTWRGDRDRVRRLAAHAALFEVLERCREAS
jgi:nicotinamide-nucleotide amidase